MHLFDNVISFFVISLFKRLSNIAIFLLLLVTVAKIQYWHILCTFVIFDKCNGDNSCCTE